LIALLLPAIQSARESARNLECINHLKQIGLAALTYEQSVKSYPSGGWGFKWVGDADRGFGGKQPGGFFYNILNFMEFKSVHDMAKKTETAAGMSAAKQMNAVPMGAFNCPSRRAPPLNPVSTTSAGLTIVNCDAFTANSDVLYHSDYKACAGSSSHGMDLYWHAGPASWASALDGSFWSTDPDALRAIWNNGICYQRSAVKFKDIVDGTAHTYLAGEKWMNPDHYFDGTDFSDDQPFLGADDFDIYGWGTANSTNACVYLPLRDKRGLGYVFTTNASPFGSNHPYTFNMVMCDGSVTSVPFEPFSNPDRKQAKFFWRACCRNDRFFGQKTEVTGNPYYDPFLL